MVAGINPASSCSKPSTVYFATNIVPGFPSTSSFIGRPAGVVAQPDNATILTAMHQNNFTPPKYREASCSASENFLYDLTIDQHRPHNRRHHQQTRQPKNHGRIDHKHRRPDRPIPPAPPHI